MPCFHTVDTSRICQNRPYELSVDVTRMIWPDPELHSPKVIILAPEDMFGYSAAAASLVHDPIMGALLVSPINEIPNLLLQELARINPKGGVGLPPVLLIGPFNINALQQIEELGYSVRQINEKTVFSTAAAVARLRAGIPPQSPDGPISVFIISADDPLEGQVVPYYAAHSGVPILLTKKQRVPKATANALRDMRNKHVYVVGSRRSISVDVLEEIDAIMEYPVQRIAGRNPFATAVEFAAMFDPVTKLGWNRNEKGQGDAFSFSEMNHWNLALAGVNFAHLGKHTPLLTIEPNQVPAVTSDYLRFLKPPFRMPPMPPFMHGFLLGTEEVISYTTQAQIEETIQFPHRPE